MSKALNRHYSGIVLFQHQQMLQCLYWKHAPKFFTHHGTCCWWCDNKGYLIWSFWHFVIHKTLISVAFILIGDKLSQETKAWAYYNLAQEFCYIIILNIMEGSSQMHRMGSISCFRQWFPEVISHVAALQEHCCSPRASSRPRAPFPAARAGHQRSLIAS